MKWTPGGSSDDIEDRRDDDSGGSGGFKTGGFGAPHLGIGGIIIVGILSLVFQKNFFQFFSGEPAAIDRPVAGTNRSATPGEAQSVEFVKFVLNDAQATWDRLLPEQTGKPYRHAKLVLFRNATQSSCGAAESATGPFYCPGDEKVYLDLEFFDELSRRFGAPGEFAKAYVVAHEIGHHVQKVLGIEGKVQRLRQSNPSQENPLSVRLELQADCFAGVWAKSTEQRKLLDPGDVQSAIGAAAAVGDDKLQRESTGRVRPESFTHGSSQQRMTWFQNGFNSGQLSACDTFSSGR
jgi:predicted metalloprotease